jgi:hypothetical protein
MGSSVGRSDLCLLLVRCRSSSAAFALWIALCQEAGDPTPAPWVGDQNPNETVVLSPLRRNQLAWSHPANQLPGSTLQLLFVFGHAIHQPK